MDAKKESRAKVPKRKDDRIIIHFDYDCFYASVFEAENPALRSLPLAVQQKQIIVTCNYEARRRGLRKLQLITEAKKICPEVVIVLGEQLDRFRDASKLLYKFLEAFTWNKKVERLGFDEVFMDVTDIVAYNQSLLNTHDIGNAFFHLSPQDPTVGFCFDATSVSGHEYPETKEPFSSYETDHIRLKLILGSHFARYLRHQLEDHKGYTSTVGISTNKLIAKLVGNVHKPKGQTTLMPPYDNTQVYDTADTTSCTIPESNVTKFIDSHEIGKIPGIGFKMAHKLRSHILSRPAVFDETLIYGGTKESVTVHEVRCFPDMGPELLEALLGGPGAERGVGGRIWALLNGVDDTEVKEMKKIPSQISIEDSYIRLDTFSQIQKEMRMLCTTLLRRMHTDLVEDDGDDTDVAGSEISKRWIAHPKTIRLTTRPRLPRNEDGTRTRSFNRISRSGPLPTFVFNLGERVETLVEKLVQETLVPMFHRLHPEKEGWNLSLMNVGVMNMAETASIDGSAGGGRDIGKMFKRQEEVLREWKVEDRDVPPDNVLMSDDSTTHPEVVSRAAEPSAGNEAALTFSGQQGSEDIITSTQHTAEDVDNWENDGEDDDEAEGERCDTCGAVMPAFAMTAHERYHLLETR